MKRIVLGCACSSLWGSVEDTAQDCRSGRSELDHRLVHSTVLCSLTSSCCSVETKLMDQCINAGTDK